MNDSLAIIVPAYKGKFLARALESIACQTDQRFRVYVGDDASPDNLSEIVGRVEFGSGQLIYHRFDANYGGTSLVRQWKRCIELSDEPWVWLFSDDDVMEPDCVAKFYAALDSSQEKFDLYRYNTIVIDGDDQVLSMNPRHPEWESWNEFAYFLLRGLRLANQQELVFRRSEYDRIGGFLNLPLAWGSDHAFAMACGMRAGIRTIEGPRIRFRQSGDNFSSRRSDETDKLKWRANAGYVKWLIEMIRTAEISEYPDRDTLEEMAKKSYHSSIRSSKKWISLGEGRHMVSFMRSQLDDSLASGIARLVLYNAITVADLVGSKARGLFVDRR